MTRQSYTFLLWCADVRFVRLDKVQQWESCSIFCSRFSRYSSLLLYLYILSFVRQRWTLFSYRLSVNDSCCSNVQTVQSPSSFESDHHNGSLFFIFVKSSNLFTSDGNFNFWLDTLLCWTTFESRWESTSFDYGRNVARTWNFGNDRFRWFGSEIDTRNDHRFFDNDRWCFDHRFTDADHCRDFQ